MSNFESKAEPNSAQLILTDEQLKPAKLLTEHLAILKQRYDGGTILDLACGHGRNGIYLLTEGFSVCFADRNLEALEAIKAYIQFTIPERFEHASFWHVDFEESNDVILEAELFSGAMVFRYLHRPLFEQIKSAVKAKGFIAYETFTVEQAKFGRPKRAEFLLQHGELTQIFTHWHKQHYFEGVLPIEEVDNGKESKINAGSEPHYQAIAQLIATK